MEYKIKQLREEADSTLDSLMRRVNADPPMSNRITVSVKGLIEYCKKIIFLCDEVNKKK